MPTTTYAQQLQGLEQLLILEHILDKEEAHRFTELARSDKCSLIHYLVIHNVVPAQTIAQIAAKNFGIPVMDLDCIDPQTLPINLIHEHLLRRYNVLPIATRNRRLYLATDDPSQHRSFKELQFHTGLNTYGIVVEADKLLNLMNQLLSPKTEAIIENTNEHDSSAIDFVDQMILDAIKKQASDIHCEPHESGYRIRYRQDGMLHEISQIPAHRASRITARIKIMSHLDIAEKRMPQDGGFKINEIDCRVSSCPSIHGEKIVIRLLDPSAVSLNIDALGFNSPQKTLFINAIERPQGMILVTGPTGSGKTLTLYSALNRLNKPEVHIATVEDPVEIKVPGITQVNVNTKIGLDFSRVLRSFLRQDPDIIMVGEIRDTETAEIAMMAAQTGHLVLSTLHSKSAIETLFRLDAMGVKNAHMIHSISMIIAQRLARRLCRYCKEIRTDLTAQALLTLGLAQDTLVYKAVGCTQCTKGYQGRIGLYEVLAMTPELGRLVLNDTHQGVLLQHVQHHGMITLYESGLEKIKQGLISLEELNRVVVE